MTSQEILRALRAGKISLEEAKKALTIIETGQAPVPDRLSVTSELTQQAHQVSEEHSPAKEAIADWTGVVGTGLAPTSVPFSPTLVRQGALAIVGMSGKYPDASNLSEYWDNLVQGKNAIRAIPPSRFAISDYYDQSPMASAKVSYKWLGVLEKIEYFDPLFFHLSPAEAEGMDPQHRLFLEEGYKAFEDAGYSPRLLNNRKCGVYLGIISHEYALLLQQKAAATNLLGTSPAIAAARIAYLLNLKGPAIAIDTACSSSLVATHLACQALWNQEIDMALVGGVSLSLTLDFSAKMDLAGMLSPDGQCKTFDASANGFVPGEGVGAVVLKRLHDAEVDHDQIYGVIIGSGINQDGATNGITAPSVKSQIELVQEIYDKYQIDPASISYVEMHGTGTKLGDPVELEALATVFQEKTLRKQYCAIGSVKTNIGHTLASAGLAGMQKVLLAMKQKKLVPSLHFKHPNEHFDFDASPFYVNTKVQDWKVEEGVPRRAAVSSFGFSGTNAHLVLEEYIPIRDADAGKPRPYSPPPHPYGPLPRRADTPCLFVLSARSEQQLKGYAQDMRSWIQAHEDLTLEDIAFTLQLGRQAMEYRLVVVADAREVLLHRLEGFVNNHASTGIYTGQVKKSENEATLFEKDSDGQSLLRIWLEKRKLEKIAQAWVKGIDIDWSLLYATDAGGAGKGIIPLPYRVSLPTYPFARESYWIPACHPDSGSGTQLDISAIRQPSLSPHALYVSDQHSRSDVAKPDEIFAFTISYLENILSRVLKISPEKLDQEAGFDEYGLDSIVIARLHAMIEDVFGPIPSTTFFRYKCIKDLARYFLNEYEETLHALFVGAVACPYPPQITECQEPIAVEAGSVHALEQDIAIIGISGHYPQAESLDAFWSNLESGRDCIVEIPQERWDYRRYYRSENGIGGKTGGMYCRWGGFLPDVDTFDPSFFHISPLEARLMDPQERLFLQIVSACFEDAGYSKHLLRDESAGDGRANVGVFAGVTYNNYQLHFIKEYEQENVVPVSSQIYSIANRVSYIYNLSGPSVALDTACSSSLYAIHLACESIKRGECAMAIAGGVNLSLHPSKYLSLCVAQFASSDGRCRSFGQDGDGYVPGEGVGAVLLKPLGDAIADRDHIYAVIKGTAVNNDGKTFGYSVPNPVAQTEVIQKALEAAHVHPRTISYIEAHGTGTRLGDPIEITGLSDAFKAYTEEKQYCAIGSVKSNIGHLEAAAGISQVAKVVLQMKYKKLVPSLLHTSKLNPNINFESTPFFVQRKLEEWKQLVIQKYGKDVVCPRRAGISSFGAGGVNVHLVLEEYQAGNDKEFQEELGKHPVIIVLSAQKEQNLRAYAQLLKVYMEKSLRGSGKMAELRDMAYTLQTGRDPLPCRLAFTVRDVERIIEKLSLFQREDLGKKRALH